MPGIGGGGGIPAAGTVPGNGGGAGISGKGGGAGIPGIGGGGGMLASKAGVKPVLFRLLSGEETDCLGSKNGGRGGGIGRSNRWTALIFGIKLSFWRPFGRSFKRSLDRSFCILSRSGRISSYIGSSAVLSAFLSEKND